MAETDVKIIAETLLTYCRRRTTTVCLDRRRRLPAQNSTSMSYRSRPAWVLASVYTAVLTPSRGRQPCL